MKFLRFIVTRSGAARRRLLASLAAGAVSGVASVGLLALVHQSLEGAEEPARVLGIAFAGLIVLVSAVRLLSVWLLAQLGQGMVKDLRLELSRRVLSSPLARLERLGAPKLLATLTDDINAMTQALVFVPAVCINGTIVVGALGYLAWLHPRMFLLLLGAVVVGMVTYYLPAQLGMARFRAARRQEDVLFMRYIDNQDEDRFLLRAPVREARLIERERNEETARRDQHGGLSEPADQREIGLESGDDGSERLLLAVLGDEALRGADDVERGAARDLAGVIAPAGELDASGDVRGVAKAVGLSKATVRKLPSACCCSGWDVSSSMPISR